MKQIWKYNIKTEDFQLEIPKDGRVISIDNQVGQGVMYVLVDPKAEKTKRKFVVRETGKDISDADLMTQQYLGTLMLLKDQYVIHLFEELL